MRGSSQIIVAPSVAAGAVGCGQAQTTTTCVSAQRPPGVEHADMANVAAGTLGHRPTKHPPAVCDYGKHA